MEGTEERQNSRRRFDYDRRLLPSRHLAALESEDGRDPGDTRSSPGYPAWNLLYYALYSSLPPELEAPVVIETGTNRGVSTIVMAKALDDLGSDAVVRTVELDPELSATARRNVEDAGLSHRVEFHVGDSLEFLAATADAVDHFDFVFLDDNHHRPHVLRELRIVCPKVAVRRGKVYFDNAAWGGVGRALGDIPSLFGGSVITFPNCSSWPPGNAIWQPD